MRTPQISLVAYNAVKGRVFVKVPNEPGRWVLTDYCVVTHSCPHCGAAIGEPCKRTQKAYGVGTHYARRQIADRRFTKLKSPPPLTWGLKELAQEIDVIADACKSLQEAAAKMARGERPDEIL